MKRLGRWEADGDTAASEPALQHPPRAFYIVRLVPEQMIGELQALERGLDVDKRPPDRCAVDGRRGRRALGGTCGGASYGYRRDL